MEERHLMLREVRYRLSPQPVSWLPDHRSPRLPRPPGPVASRGSLPGHSGGTAPDFHRPSRALRTAAAYSDATGYGAPMTARAGRDALFDVLASEGVRHIFGNPGTTEL